MARQRVVAAGLGVEEINGVAELRWWWLAVQLELLRLNWDGGSGRGEPVRSGDRAGVNELAAGGLYL
jgi:hypothetical protein